MRLLDGGGEAYPAMLAAIAAARSEIFLEVYQLSPAGIGARFIAELSAAARRGVRVEVILDGFGSAPCATEVAEALSAAGCEVQIGGGSCCSSPAACAATTARSSRWTESGPSSGASTSRTSTAALRRRPTSGRGRTSPSPSRGRSRPGYSSAPAASTGGARRGRCESGSPEPAAEGSCGGATFKSFGGARRTLDVAHAYFLPDRRLVRSMTAAARRGVDVRLVVPGASDLTFLRPATRRLYRRLLRAGVRMSREWSRSVLHAKAAAVDGARLLVGSFNLDPLSLANLEALVVVDEAATAADRGALDPRPVRRGRGNHPRRDRPGHLARAVRGGVDRRGRRRGRLARRSVRRPQARGEDGTRRDQPSGHSLAGWGRVREGCGPVAQVLNPRTRRRRAARRDAPAHEPRARPLDPGSPPGGPHGAGDHRSRPLDHALERPLSGALADGSRGGVRALRESAEPAARRLCPGRVSLAAATRAGTRRGRRGGGRPSAR